MFVHKHPNGALVIRNHVFCAPTTPQKFPKSLFLRSFFHAIWNTKAYVVYLITKMNPFKSKYFFWVDIGAFRTDRDAEKWKSTGAWKQWPDVQAVKESFLGPN